MKITTIAKIPYPDNLIVLSPDTLISLSLLNASKIVPAIKPENTELKMFFQ